jgi:hypothetical protein
LAAVRGAVSVSNGITKSVAAVVATFVTAHPHFGLPPSLVCAAINLYAAITGQPELNVAVVGGVVMRVVTDASLTLAPTATVTAASLDASTDGQMETATAVDGMPSLKDC